MRSFALVAASVLGCASAEASAPLASAAAPDSTIAAPTILVAQVEPAPAASGWPSASSEDASREQTKARFEQLAAERDALEHAVERGAPEPSGRRCVTPEAKRTGDAQPDLRLEVRGPKKLAKDAFPELTGTIHNTSRRNAHAIVLPGDGSDAGWRDPVISFTAFIDEGDGCWKPLARAAVGRCGMFDSNWTDEIVSVAAGSKRALDPMWSWPAFAWKPGKVRLFVHYAWTGGAASKGGGTSSVDLGAMAKEKPYELVSNAIDIVVTR